MDDVPEDPLTGGDVHLNGIKGHLYDNHFSIAWPTVKIGSLGAVAVSAHWFKDQAQYLPYEFESSNNIIEFLLFVCCHVYKK